MRFFLIILATIVLAFIGSIVWSLTQNTIKSSQQKTPLGSTVETENLAFYKEALEKKQKENEALKEIVIDLAGSRLKDSGKTGWEKGDTKEGASSGLSQSGNTHTDESSKKSEPKIIPISGKFLSLVMPEANLKIEVNKGIYGFSQFENIPYSTYFDAKLGLKVIAVDVPYQDFLSSLKSVTKGIYNINETLSFPFKSFYLNAIKPDTLVRLVLESEGQTIAIEIPKMKFATLKWWLVKMDSNTQTRPTLKK